MSGSPRTSFGSRARPWTRAPSPASSVVTIIPARPRRGHCAPQSSPAAQRGARRTRWRRGGCAASLRPGTAKFRHDQADTGAAISAKSGNWLARRTQEPLFARFAAEWALRDANKRSCGRETPKNRQIAQIAAVMAAKFLGSRGATDSALECRAPSRPAHRRRRRQRAAAAPARPALAGRGRAPRRPARLPHPLRCRPSTHRPPGPTRRQRPARPARLGPRTGAGLASPASRLPPLHHRPACSRRPPAAPTQKNQPRQWRSWLWSKPNVTSRRARAGRAPANR